MVRLRLARTKGRDTYSIVAAHSRFARDGRRCEKLGYYNPTFARESAERLKMNLDRVQHWILQGAQPSDRMARLIKQYSGNEGFKLSDRVSKLVEKISSKKHKPNGKKVEEESGE